jgi:hypothetical protein
MSEKQGLKLIEYTATGINTVDEIYRVLFSDEEGDGAIANELEAVTRFIDFITRTDNVSDQVERYLDMIIALFIGMARRQYEADYLYVRHLLALTSRSQDTVWGTKWDIKHVFEEYFSVLKAYVCENTNESGTGIQNGDFEEIGDIVWELGGGAKIGYAARFSGSKGLYFNREAGSASQSVELMRGVYTLHFFLLGKTDVTVTNTAGQYWNMNTLAWQDGAIVSSFYKEIWDNCEMFIKILPEEGDTITIKFIAAAEEVVSIDYVRLYEKLNYPAYTVVIQYEGYAIADKTLHLGKGEDDPDPEITWYPRESHFDHSYIVGRIGAYRTEVYISLLDIIRPRGIRAFIERVEKVTED